MIDDPVPLKLLLTLEPPFANQTEAGVILAVVSRSRPKRSKDSGWCTDELWDLVERCWAHEPHTRPKADDVLRKLEDVSTSLRISSFKPPSIYTSSFVTSPTPKDHIYGSLEPVSPSLKEAELPTWTRHDKDLFSDLLEPYDVPISPVPSLPLVPPISLPSLSTGNGSPSLRSPNPALEVTTAPSAPKCKVLKLKELWSTPTRTKHTGRHAGVGSNTLNLSPRKRPTSRGSTISGGSDSDENSHSVSGSGYRIGTS
ncbi:hypothetical protein PM082_016600 [Marasmius tenuissimus]|nr:hypothetical protein PM082_016600 [Marasmius tenuissimus]